MTYKIYTQILLITCSIYYPVCALLSDHPCMNLAALGIFYEKFPGTFPTKSFIWSEFQYLAMKAKIPEKSTVLNRSRILICVTLMSESCQQNSKTACELRFAHCFLINFTYAKCKVTFLSSIHYPGKSFGLK